MTEEEQQQHIQDYLHGLLGPGERNAFEQAAQNSLPLAAELLRHRQMRVYQQNRDLIRAKALLAQISTELAIEPAYGSHKAYFPKNRAQGGWVFSLLAAIMLIAGALFFQNRQSALHYASIAQEQLQPLDNIIGFDRSDQSDAAMGMQAYDQKNYAFAEKRLSLAMKQSPDDHSLRLYLAISQLMQQEHDQAQKHLQLLAETQSIATVPAKWYYALSLLQATKSHQAKSLLQSISRDTIYGEKAKLILKNW
jgi:hypothetical protein